MGTVKPVYCVRLDGPSWSVPQRQAVRGGVEKWVEEEYPIDERGPGVSVRVDNEDPERWWRYTIDVSLGSGALSNTTVTLLMSDLETTFEVRTAVVAGGKQITPQSVQIKDVPMRTLVARVINKGLFRDADHLVSTKDLCVADVVQAQAIAAFCYNAPSRSMPVIIETCRAAASSAFEIEKVSKLVAGLAHVVKMTSEQSVRTFNEFAGVEALKPQGLVIIWSDRSVESWSGNGLAPGKGTKERAECKTILTHAAANSLAPLRAPRFRQRPIEQSSPAAIEVPIETQTADPAAEPETVPYGEWKSACDGWQEEANKVDELLHEVDELLQARAVADRIVADMRELLDKTNAGVDQLLLQNVELAILASHEATGIKIASAHDAVKQADAMCEYLTFIPEAFDTAKKLASIDANRLLLDLKGLNWVANDWRAGRVNNASLTVSCRARGLNYAAGVGDNAENKYGSDYAFTWRGETHFAFAHIRNGKGPNLYRVHFFFDDQTRKIVVAYVGRHLRGKRDHN